MTEKIVTATDDLGNPVNPRTHSRAVMCDNKKSVEENITDLTI